MPAPLGPITPTIAPAGMTKAEVVDEHAIAERLAHVLEFDHRVAEPFRDRYEDLLRLVPLLVLVGREFLEARDARLALRLPPLGIGADPLEFLVHRLHAGVFLLLLGSEALLLLLEPGTVVALPRNAVAAIEFQDPFGGVVQEVAIVRDRDHGTREARQELLEPFHALGVEVVGRFVEQQHVRLGQQQPAQCDTPLFATGERADFRVPRGQPQRVGGDFHLHAGIRAVGGDDRFVFRLVGGELVEVRVGLGVRGVDLVEPGLGFEHRAHAFLDDLAHGLIRVELRLLRQVTDAQIGHRHRLAFEFDVGAGHDAQQAGLAGAVEPQHADLGPRKERERNVLEDDALGGHDLAHPIHGVNVLSHR